MSFGSVTIQVLSADRVANLEGGSISGAYYVAHIGAERYRSETQQVRGDEITFDDTFTFQLPAALKHVDFQLWAISSGGNDTLIGEGDLQISQAMQGQQTHRVNLQSRSGDHVGVLNVKPDFDGDSERYHETTRNIQTDPSQYHESSGVHDNDFQERSFFGNKKQQYDKPPSQAGFQGPGQQPGQKNANLNNILLGVGVSVAAIGAGVAGYEIYEHYHQKNQHRPGM